MHIEYIQPEDARLIEVKSSSCLRADHNYSLDYFVSSLQSVQTDEVEHPAFKADHQQKEAGVSLGWQKIVNPSEQNTHTSMDTLQSEGERGKQ
jgi:hypothetical protein